MLAFAVPTKRAVFYSDEGRSMNRDGWSDRRVALVVTTSR
jgi:hypothetical protein